MLVGLQHICLLDVLGMPSESSCATLCHFKKPKYPFRKTSRSKFLDVKLARFAVRLAAPMENNRSTATKLGKAAKGCCQARSQDLEKGGGYFERVRSVQTALTRIFIDLESVSDGLSEI